MVEDDGVARAKQARARERKWITAGSIGLESANIGPAQPKEETTGYE
jgi:hypothetical protein